MIVCVSLQMCCNVQIPGVFGGSGGQAVFIDTHGGLVIDRLVNMATALVSHLQSVTKHETDKGTII